LLIGGCLSSSREANEKIAKGRGHLGAVGVDGRGILKRILLKQGVKMWSWIQLAQYGSTMAGFCKRDDELLGSLKA